MYVAKSTLWHSSYLQFVSTFLLNYSGISRPSVKMMSLKSTCACHELRLVYNMMLHHALHCVAFVSTLVTTQRNTRIDSDSILVFLCIAFLHLIAKTLQIEIFAFRKPMQCMVQRHICEPTFRIPIVMYFMISTA